MVVRNLLNNLYPPIIDTYMPAFIRDNTCKVYFSISNFNSYEDILNAQVTVKNQNSNSSALKKEIYPNGIKICKIYIDTDVDNDYKYYIEINPKDLKNGFELNQYYKIQIRFTHSNIPEDIEIDSSTGAAKNEGHWLAVYTQYFSEWSTVCLIHGISRPILTVYNFEDSNNETSMTITTEMVDFNATLSFKDDEKELLKSYRVRLLNTKGEVLNDSGDIYTSAYNNVNQINYTFDYALVDGESYQVQLDILTRNLYSETFFYDFNVIQNSLDPLNAEIKAEEDNELGCITIKLIDKGTEPFSGNITIRRTSSKSNFKIWEDVHTVSLNESTPLNYTWKDFSIESGIWYKYCAQRRNALGYRGIVLQIEKPVMSLFEDIFLVGENTELRIKYNPSISSLKRTVSDAKTDTIGSQYPFIKRNAFTKYRQFPIGGMITLFTDYEETFVTKEELLGASAIELYDNYNWENRINPHTDYVYERLFREKVMDFLYEDKVRLFRSLTEGNILIRLMDVSLSPETTLGRQIYSFSATAYEIDDFTIKNLNKYNIQNLGSYEELIVHPKYVLGQLKEKVKANDDVITKVLQEKYNKIAKNGYINQIKYLNSLKIEMQTPPYLIKDFNGNLTPLKKGDEVDDSTVLGYIIYVNGKAILISPEGYYELRGEDVKITSLYFPVDTEISIDYEVLFDETEDISKLPKLIYYSSKIGQVWGTFKYKDSVFRRINKRYKLRYNDYYQDLLSINGIKIEANPGTVIWIRESKDMDFERFVLNDTGSLQIYDEDSVIDGLYFSGIHLEPANEIDLKREQVPYNKFVETGLTFDNILEIKNPIYNGVYKVNNLPSDIYIEDEENDISLIADQLYNNMIKTKIENCKRVIFHEGKWKIITEDNDILDSVDAIVDYYCDIMKGVYKKDE